MFVRMVGEYKPKCFPNHTEIAPGCLPTYSPVKYKPGIHRGMNLFATVVAGTGNKISAKGEFTQTST